MRYLTWKLELVSNTLWVAGALRDERQRSVINFFHRTSHPRILDSTGVLDMPLDVLKSILKITIKIKWNGKTKYTLLYTEKPDSHFSPAKCPKKHSQRSDMSGKDTSRWPTFLLKNSLSRRPPHTPLVKTNRLLSPQTERWIGLKCITYTGNVIQT